MAVNWRDLFWPPVPNLKTTISFSFWPHYSEIVLITTALNSCNIRKMAYVPWSPWSSGSFCGAWWLYIHLLLHLPHVSESAAPPGWRGQRCARLGPLRDKSQPFLQRIGSLRTKLLGPRTRLGMWTGPGRTGNSIEEVRCICENTETIDSKQNTDFQTVASWLPPSDLPLDKECLLGGPFNSNIERYNFSFIVTCSDLMTYTGQRHLENTSLSFFPFFFFNEVWKLWEAVLLGKLEREIT